MRLPAFAFAFAFVVLSACAASPPRRPEPSAQLVVAVPAVPSAAAPVVETLPSAWERGDAEHEWVRREGANAAPLVVRGLVEPVEVHAYGAECQALLGARHGTAPITLRVRNAARLHLYVKGRGPIGIGVDYDRCVVTGPNEWARLTVPVEDFVTVAIADVDVKGERRGQTSPFVLVVSEDDHEPDLEPDPRAAVSPSDVVVRWAVEPRACAHPIEMRFCATAAIELSGAVTRRIPLKDRLTGQLGCWPQGTGVHCGGPSGMTNVTLETSPDGTVEVRATSESDGYCPPPEDCASRTTLTRFTIPRGTKLIPDPAGTWPPLR